VEMRDCVQGGRRSLYNQVSHMTQTSEDTRAGSVAAAVRGPVVRGLELRGPVGRLEALYAPGRADARYAVVVAHPHPLFGGTMHNKVVYHAAKAFQQFGLPVLRFNFRGAGASEGVHDRGEGEREDLTAALAWVARETGLPVIAAGFSFGAWVTLRVCCAGAGMDVRGVVALGLPIQAGDRGYTYEFLSGCRVPALFVSGTADEFGPIAAVSAAFAEAAAPSELVFVPGADHFFQGTCFDRPADGLLQMQQAIRAWVETWFLGSLAGSGEPR
jgi:alpha/beta superfamily hydrolase